MLDIFEMKAKNIGLVGSILVICTLTYVPWFDSCQWVDYLGNSQRTGYSACTGPGAPEILWKVEIPGDFYTSPFIIEDKVVIHWTNSRYHPLEVKAVVIDLFTGDVLQKVGQPGLLFSEIFPVGNRIIGISGRRVYEIDMISEEIILLVEIPEESSSGPSGNSLIPSGNMGTFFVHTSNNYPVVLKDKIIFPTIPAICISRSNFDIVWNLKDKLDSNSYAGNVVGDEDIVVFIMIDDELPQLLSANPSTGELKWMSNPLPFARWLALGDNAIYCGGKNLWAFSKEGETLWEFEPEDDIVSNIVLGPDAVYLIDAANNLYKIDTNGNLVWKTDWEASPPYYENHLIGAGGILYCIGNSGDPASVSRSYVTAFNMKDGSELWNLEFGLFNYIKAPPAIAGGILVIGKMGGEIIAFASDPDLFVKQGDTFLSEGYTEKAINSYKKAAELYEQKGDLSQSEEMQKRIDKLETPSESPPETTPPETSPESTLPPTQEPSNQISLSLLIFTGTLAGIFIVYSLVKRKRV